MKLTPAIGALALLFSPAAVLAQNAAPAASFAQVTAAPIPLHSVSGRFSSLNPVNQQMKARMHEAFGAGYDYTYLFPGLQKVVQAAGRVIRGPQDRGVLYLIDDRFARPEVRCLLPPWWRVEVMRQRDAVPGHRPRDSQPR